MGSSSLDIIRGIRGDKKRAQEIIQFIVSGSSFDRIRESEINGIESRLSKIKEAVEKGDLKVEESIAKEIEAGLSIARQTREVVSSRESSKKAKAVQKQEKKKPVVQQTSYKGELSFEEVAGKLRLSPEAAARIKSDPQKAMREAQERLQKLKEEKERSETARKKKVRGY